MRGQAPHTSTVTTAAANALRFMSLRALPQEPTESNGLPVWRAAPMKGSTCMAMMMIATPDVKPETTE